MRHASAGILQGLPNPLSVGRYHSLIVELDGQETPLEAAAWSQEDEIMLCDIAITRPSACSFIPNRY